LLLDPEILATIRARSFSMSARPSQTIPIICFGDSITQAYGPPERDRWPMALQQRLDDWQPGRFKVFNRGIGGQTSSQGLDRIGCDVAPLLPGIVLIQFGFNDAVIMPGLKAPRVGVDGFQAKLREIHRVVRAGRGRPVFIINHTERSPDRQENGRTYQENYKPYDKALRQVAKSLRAAAIDLPLMMKERAVNLDAFLAADGIHLTPDGNHLYADMVFEGLRSCVKTPGA